MAKVKTVLMPIGTEYEFDPKEWVILNHWYDSTYVILFLGVPDEEILEEVED